MNQNSSNDVQYGDHQPNSNKVILQNPSSKFDKRCYNNDNFWAVDPLLFGDRCKSVEENILKSTWDSQTLSSHPNWLSELENRNSSLNLSNICPNQDETSVNPSSLVLKDLSDQKPISRRLNKKCNQKLPIHFIDTKDWQSYMELANIRNASIANLTNRMPKPAKFKNNKTYRLLNSLFNLYQEYSELSEEYERLHDLLSNKYLSADSLSSDGYGYNNANDPSLHMEKQKKKQKPMFVPDAVLEHDNNIDIKIHNPNSMVETISTCSQTTPVLEWSELSDSQLADVAFNPDTMIDNTKRWNLPGSINSKRISMSTPSEQSVASSKSKRLKVCDHLIRQNFLGEQEIDIIEELVSNRIVLNHKMNLIASSNDSQDIKDSTDDMSTNDLVNHPNFIFNSIAIALRCATSKTGSNSNANNSSLINLPIIMEIMLPKMQAKITQIFEECSFLNNPLEIMAELRYFNYNKKATIDHFKSTRQLRGSIKEFFNNNIDSRCRLVVLGCLYSSFYQNSHKNNSMKHMLACSNCGKEIVENYNYLNGNFISPEDGMEYLKLFDGETDPIQIAASEAERATVDMYSKSTVVETEILDNSFQDSFCQTQNIVSPLSLESIQRFAEIFLKNVSSLKQSIKESKIQMGHLRRQVSSILKALKNNIDLIISLSSKHFMSDQHRNRIILLARQVEELKLKLKEEETKRRSVYNLMQEQMGNVRVYCRCRDVAHSENVLDIQGNESIVLPISPQERFDFDKVFPSNMSQKDIYEEFRPLVMSFIDGFNVCFITYGSEASGKTYTLIGGNLENTEEHGIMQRTLNTLLTEQELRNRDWDYVITACLVEIYNDNCIDILSGDSGIQLYVDCGMESVYQKLKSVPITNETDTEALLQLCRTKRKIAKTALNPASSRSHLITLIRLQGKSKIHGENILSFMCLCDLAGFEDIIKAETQSNKTLSKEAGYINKSLTAFNRVFVSLRRQDPNTVCYRDTKLTHLLKPFLTNSGKCALVITIRTDRRSLSSTQNTLRFGRETRGVSLGKARRQVNVHQQ